MGAPVFLKNPMKGSGTNSHGITILTWLERRKYELEASFIVYRKATLFHNVSSN